MKGALANLIATARGLSASCSALDVCLVDSSGNQVTSFGGSGGTASNFGATFPASGTAAGASDGVNMQPLQVDGSGFLKVNVAAGSGGNGAASNTGAAVPAQADYGGINVGGTLRGRTGYDADTGAGTEYVAGVVLRKSASGGSVELGTSSDPVRVDPTGSTAQPITHANLDVALSTLLSLTDFDSKTGSLTEAAPASDTASSGLNGRLQRIAQRLTSMIALLPAALTGSGNFKVALSEDTTAPTTVLNGNKNVTTAGTRVTLAASTACKSVVIKAKIANTGVIYVGNSTVSSANGFALAAGEVVSLPISDLTTVNIDSSVNGEGVTYLGVN